MCSVASEQKAMCNDRAVNWFVVENKAPAVEDIYREPYQKDLTSGL